MSWGWAGALVQLGQGGGGGVRGWGAALDLGRPAGEDGLGEGEVSLVLGRAPRGDRALWIGVGNNPTYTRGCFWSQAWGLRSPPL